MTRRTQKTRNALAASAGSLMLCCALLVGTTFAWFTDSVINQGNTIQTGSLSIDAMAYCVDPNAADKKYRIPGVNGGQPFNFAWNAGRNLSGDPIITGNPWEPGASDARLITITNQGSLAAQIRLRFATQDTDAAGNPAAVKLQDALWFDFVRVNTDTGEILGRFEKKPMRELQAVADKVTVPLAAGESVSFILAYGMDAAAGNAYQNLKFTADVTVQATQAPVEEAGFGSNRYDAQAHNIPDEDAVTTQAELTAALAAGGTVTLGNDITIAPQGYDCKGELLPQMSVTRDTVLDLGAQTLGVRVDENDAAHYTPLLIQVNGGTLTIQGDPAGTISTETGERECYGINILGGSVVIKGGNYYGASTAIQLQKGSLVIEGGFFDLAPTYKSQAPEYARYLLNCIDSNYQNGTATVEIRGGTFVNFDPAADPEGTGTSYLAAGYRVEAQEQDNGDTWYTVLPE